MKESICQLNKKAKLIKKDIDELNRICEELNGKEVIIPEDANGPIQKFVGRKALLSNVHFDSYGGNLHAIIDVLYLDDSSKIANYPESNYYYDITETWFNI